MKDEQILKGLEHCTKDACRDCPYNQMDKCVTMLMLDALNTIKGEKDISFAVNKVFFEGYKIGVVYGKQCLQREEKTTPYMLDKSFVMPKGDKSTQEKIAEQKAIYLSTALRLARMGKKTPQEQIAALAEEIEYYRSRIRALENFINQRPTKEDTQ